MPIVALVIVLRQAFLILERMSFSGWLGIKSLFWRSGDAQDKISDFEMKLMDIDSEHLGIPEAEYHAIVRMPLSEFVGICIDLSSIGDTGVISVTEEGVKFSTRGDIGTANIVSRQNTTVDKESRMGSARTILGHYDNDDDQAYEDTTTK